MKALRAEGGFLEILVVNCDTGQIVVGLTEQLLEKVGVNVNHNIHDIITFWVLPLCSLQQLHVAVGLADSLNTHAS